MIKVRVVGTKELDNALALQRKNISAERFAPLLKMGTDRIKELVAPHIPSRTGRLRRAFVSMMLRAVQHLRPAAFYIGLKKYAAKDPDPSLGFREPTPYLHLAVWGSRARVAGTGDLYRRAHPTYVRPGFRRSGLPVRAISIPWYGARGVSGKTLFARRTKGARANPQIITAMKAAARQVGSLLRRVVRRQLLREVRHG